MLVQGGAQTQRAEGTRHLDSPDGVHVGGDDGNALINLAAVAKAKFSGDIDLGPRPERGTLGPDQDVFKVEFDFLFDAHATILQCQETNRTPGASGSPLENPR